MELFGFEIKFSPEVYVPREDTYLMVETLREEVEEGDRVLDLGTGSGILSFIAAEVCEEVVGVDVNENAVRLARENASRNGFENVEFLASDLFEEVKGKFDLVVFNAPYLPGGAEGEDVEGSEQWLGGETGREIVARFAEGLENYLNEDAKALLLVSSLTDPEEVIHLFKEEGFEVKVAKEKKIPWETLYVLEVF
ncbi:MAG: HemK2/MTQ2 family protein methyltransferase [Candidatus Aenigmatarchaeota archaeon]